LGVVAGGVRAVDAGAVGEHAGGKVRDGNSSKGEDEWWVEVLVTKDGCDKCDSCKSGGSTGIAVEVAWSVAWSVLRWTGKT
jgi:hypothetical protein